MQCSWEYAYQPISMLSDIGHRDVLWWFEDNVPSAMSISSHTHSLFPVPYSHDALRVQQRSPLVQWHRFSSLNLHLQQYFVNFGSHVVVAVTATFLIGFGYLWLCKWYHTTIGEDGVWYAVSFDFWALQLKAEYFIRYRHCSSQPVVLTIRHVIGNIWHNSHALDSIFRHVVQSLECLFLSTTLFECAFIVLLKRGQSTWSCSF